MSFLQDRLKINQDGHIKDKEQAARNAASFPDMSAAALEAKLTASIVAAEKNDIETVPRETVIKMLSNKKLDEHFIFNVAKGQGDHYIQAMRQILTRTKKKARNKKVQLNDFKLYRVSVEEKEDHDVVTLMRSRSIPEHLQSTYDEIVDLWAAKK